MRNICTIFALSVFTASCAVNSFTIGNENIGLDENGLAISSSSDEVTYGNPDCKVCTNTVNGQFANAVPFLSKFDNQYITGWGSCDYCVASGVATLRPYGDSCTYPVPNQPNQVDTKVNLIISKLSVRCQCQFSSTWTYLQKQLQNFTIPIVNCGMDSDQATQVVEGTVQGGSAVLTQTKIAVSDLQTCALIKSAGLVNTNVTVERYNMTLSLTLRDDKTVKGPKSTTVQDVHMTSRKYENTHTTCEGNDKFISRGTPNPGPTMCDCLLESQVFNTLVDDGAGYSLTCSFKNESDVELRGMLNSYLSCA